MPNHSEVSGPAMTKLPPSAGVGLKPEHYEAILAGPSSVGWFEVHPENYMGAGGPPHHFLALVRERHPLSLHGVGLSIGGALPLDKDHLARLRSLVDRYQPAAVSEHLAWSTHDGGFMNDLLPLPYTSATLAIVCDHIDAMQTALGRPVLLENPSTYVSFVDDEYFETDFLKEIACRSGCGLLLDVNNVFVQCTNRGWKPRDYLSCFPLSLVGEIHLAGHATDSGDDGETLLIDSHDRAVIDEVWGLYGEVIARAGPLPTLIEWDEDIPDWAVLAGEAAKAEAVLERHARQETTAGGAARVLA